MFNYSSIGHLVVSILDTDVMNGQTTFYLDLLNNVNCKQRTENPYIFPQFREKFPVMIWKSTYLNVLPLGEATNCVTYSVSFEKSSFSKVHENEEFLAWLIFKIDQFSTCQFPNGCDLSSKDKLKLVSWLVVFTSCRSEVPNSNWNIVKITS